MAQQARTLKCSMCSSRGGRSTLRLSRAPISNRIRWAWARIGKVSQSIEPTDVDTQRSELSRHRAQCQSSGQTTNQLLECLTDCDSRYAIVLRQSHRSCIDDCVHSPGSARRPRSSGITLHYALPPRTPHQNRGNLIPQHPQKLLDVSQLTGTSTTGRVFPRQRLRACREISFVNRGPQFWAATPCL